MPSGMRHGRARSSSSDVPVLISAFQKFEFNSSRPVWGPAMDMCRSFYLAPGQDYFAESAPDVSRVNFNDIPYITAANDNFRVKDRLSARCGDLLRRLIGLHSG
jgi:hypothetical protein